MRRALKGPYSLALVLVLAVVVSGSLLAAAQNYGDDPPTAAANDEAPSGEAGAALVASVGTYTTDQAARGAELFSSRCSGCHGADLSGGFGPRLAPLADAWRGLSLGSLFRFVSSNMPYDNPGSLQVDQYLDVIAFVLQRNGYPAGSDPLVADAAVLDLIALDGPPPAP